MALTAAQARDAWNQARVKNDAMLGSVFSKADLDAAAVAVDGWCTANQASFLAAIPEPFKTTSSAAQKSLLLAFIAMKRGGVI